MTSVSKREANTPCISSVDELIDRAELARRLGVHVRTIRRMIDRGELPRPCIGEGGRPRWLWRFVLDHCRKHHERQAKVARRMPTRSMP